MNKTNAEDDKIQAVSPELTSAWALDEAKAKVTKKIKRNLIKTNPFFATIVDFIYIIVNLNKY